MTTAQTAEPINPRDEPDDSLLECLAILTRLHGRPVSTEALAAGLPLENHRLTPTLFVRAAEAHESMHLVQVAPDRATHEVEAAHEGIVARLIAELPAQRR